MFGLYYIPIYMIVMTGMYIISRKSIVTQKTVLPNL